MRTISRWIWAVFLLAGLGASRAEAAGFDRTPLLNVEADVQFRLIKTDRYHERFFIATDGTADGNLSLSPSFSFWMTARGSAQGSESQLGALQQALTAGRIGLRNGRCSIARLSGWSGTYAITWYGAGGRISQLTVELTGPVATSPSCAAPVADIIRAIENYGQDVLGISIGGQLV